MLLFVDTLERIVTKEDEVMGSSLAMAGWVVVRDDTPIDYIVNSAGRSAEFSFGPEFDLTLSEKSLEHCLALFSQALSDLRKSIAG